MLARRARAGHGPSRDALILRNQRLVWAIAQQYTGLGLDMDDLVQEGMTGLIKAADRFDPGRGVAFSTYATYWIRQSIQRAIERMGRLVRIPGHLIPTLTALRQAETAAPPTATEPAGSDSDGDDAGGAEGPEADDPEEDVSDADTPLPDPATRTALLRAAAPIASLQDTARPDSDTELEDLIADPDWIDPELAAAQSQVREEIARLLDLLPARERAIVRARFGFDGEPATLEQLAARYSLSPERIRQIQDRALARLRKAGRLLGLDAMARDSELL
jgi:RNA polymerase primary sigma factor